MRINVLVTLALAMSALLPGCGGGGSDGSAATTCKPTMINPDLCNTGGTGSTGTAAAKLTLADPAGAATTQVSPDRAGTLTVVVTDAKGTALPNLAVTFTSSDKTAVFVPASGTALTDATGTAKVGLPVGTQAGGFTATASALVAGSAVTGSTGYAVAFPTLTLGALTVTPANLSAGGTTSLAITVLNGAAPYAAAQSVAFSSPCAAAGKATISSPVTTVNGIASTSYTDKGCGGPDTITASTTLAGATATRTATVTALAATAGQVNFASALPQNISMKSTGGAGRQESSTVTFNVLDKSGQPVSGIAVDFSLTTTVGGLTINPAFGTSGADGKVTTVVAAGIVNTPVRVLATIRGTALSTLSDQLVISTGIADQNSFTAVPAVYNIECLTHDGTDFTTVSAFVADHFNNPVPDGSAVSFTTEAGAIDASCLTGLKQTTLTDGSVITQKGLPGQCSVRFICQNPRLPNVLGQPWDGRSTVLAYALGEESFSDDPAIANGINRYDGSETFGDLREPFRYDRAIVNAKSANSPGSALAPVVGEPFIDSDGSGLWNSTGDGFYNGVLQAAPNGKTPTIHVRDSFVLVFSGSTAVITALSPVPVVLDHCVDGTPFVNTAKTFVVAVRDTNPTVFAPNTLAGNILPAGTRIEFLASNGKVLGETSVIVPNTNEPSSAVWTYFVSVISDASQSGPLAIPPLACSNPITSGPLTVKVTTPLGVVTSQPFTVTD